MLLLLGISWMELDLSFSSDFGLSFAGIVLSDSAPTMVNSSKEFDSRKFVVGLEFSSSTVSPGFRTVFPTVIRPLTRMLPNRSCCLFRRFDSCSMIVNNRDEQYLTLGIVQNGSVLAE